MKKKVFILDDDESLLKLLEKAFKRDGFEVAVKSSSMGTTNEIRKLKPDFVILDVMLPDLSGDAFVELIYKNIHPRPKIIFYSGKTAEELSRLAAEKGVDGFVSKSEGPRALIDKIKSF